MTARTPLVLGGDGLLQQAQLGDTVAVPGLSIGGTDDLALAWTAYTPTITNSTGALTNASATGRYKRIGKTILVSIRGTITTDGRGMSGADPNLAGYVQVGLPIGTAAADQCMSGRHNTSPGKGLTGLVFAGQSLLYVTVYDNSYAGGNGVGFVVSGIYEAA